MPYCSPALKELLFPSKATKVATGPDLEKVAFHQIKTMATRSAGSDTSIARTEFKVVL